MGNSQEYLEIKEKQHYIPRVYLRQFKSRKSNNKKQKIFLHNKKNKIFEQDINEVFQEKLYYTGCSDYLNAIDKLKTILKEEIDGYINNIGEIFKKTQKKTEQLMKEVIEKTELDNETDIKDTNVLTIGYKYYKKNPFYLEILKEILEKYSKESVKKINIFINSTRIKINLLKKKYINDDLKGVKELSSSFYKLEKDLEKDLEKNKKSIKNIKEKVDKLSNNDKEDNDKPIIKEASNKFNTIIYESLKEISFKLFSKILKKLNNIKNTAVLEDKLGLFEGKCILSKNKNIFSENDLIRGKLKDDLKFRILKYILVQYYRFYSLTDKKWGKLVEILGYKNYNDICKRTDLKLLKLNGILIKIDKKIFCTSDNPILYDEKLGIVIFPFSPSIIYIVIEKYHKELKLHILNLKYREEQKLIKNINFLIKNNSFKLIISKKKKILTRKISKENFIIKFEEILKKCNLIKK